MRAHTLPNTRHDSPAVVLHHRVPNASRRVERKAETTPGERRKVYVNVILGRVDEGNATHARIPLRKIAHVDNKTSDRVGWRVHDYTFRHLKHHFHVSEVA
jgi:hypothetical protein